MSRDLSVLMFSTNNPFPLETKSTRTTYFCDTGIVSRSRDDRIQDNCDSVVMLLCCSC